MLRLQVFLVAMSFCFASSGVTFAQVAERSEDGVWCFTDAIVGKWEVD